MDSLTTTKMEGSQVVCSESDVEYKAEGSLSSTEPEAAGKKSVYRKVCDFFGFKKGYNLPLYIITAGYMLGFTLAKLRDLDYDGQFPTQIKVGDWYFMHTGKYRVGLIIHLATVLPAGLLMILQFVPKIRSKWLLFHRINGYLVITLLLLANAGSLMILRRATQGLIATQAAEGMLIILTTIGLCMGYYNVKRLQLDQHRAWMLRTMILYGAIITVRPMTLIAVPIINKIGSYYSIWSCDQVDFTYKQFGIDGILAKKYPQCLQPNGTNDGMIVVHATNNLNAPEEMGAAFELEISAALWISVMLHLVMVELYLHLTPKEQERLRKVSYEKQLEAGFKNPGNAGTTVQKFGDSYDWKPRQD